MLRQIHSLPGWMAALFVTLLAVTGAMLSLHPLQAHLQSVQLAQGQATVAELAELAKQRYPGVEEIKRSADGIVSVYFSENNQVQRVQINPLTGAEIPEVHPSELFRWSKNMHRTLLMADTGRIVIGISALCTFILSISGALLVAKRAGGWRHFFHKAQGTQSQRLHVVVGRAALLGLLLSSSTGLYLSAGSLGLISEASEADPAFPDHFNDNTDNKAHATVPLGRFAALQSTDLRDLRSLVFPSANSANEPYFLMSNQGAGYVDASTGEMLTFEAHNTARKIYEWIYALHTGEGLWWLALVLGISALSVPALAITGVTLWWKRRKLRSEITDNSAPENAETLILVGSETGTTWKFANALHRSLRRAGQRVHTAPLDQLEQNYPSARHLLILTATYGEGSAPASAQSFLSKLREHTGLQSLRYAVLGFGDRQFPKFCQYAYEVDAALQEKGLQKLCPITTADRQSVQEFARWGQALTKAMPLDFTLEPVEDHRKTDTFTLIERIDYDDLTDAPSCVLRFQASALQQKKGGRRLPTLPHFEAGDLVAILPPETSIPRFYSLASSASDGFLEICVRRQKNGLCSRFLHTLKVGDTIKAFIQPNPHFRPEAGESPVILIGAGAGIGPLAGFIRHNVHRRPMHLYWGGRTQQSGFLYQEELNRYLKDHRLSELNTAFSRENEPSYVQDRIRANGDALRDLFSKGAQVLVCGGRDMARGVQEALDAVIAPLAMDTQTLITQGRYREDVY
ncbi:Putative oxidoreductase, FAD-binding [gamma proteobacterium HdN1]|nr:Putative oxidoreductase, FAD-binding [gamma proteobacterium HdN1]